MKLSPIALAILLASWTAAPSTGSEREAIIAECVAVITKAGKRPTVYVDFAGRTLRAKVVGATSENLVIKATIGQLPMAWPSISDRRLFFIGRKLIPESASAKRLTLGKLALRAGLTDEARTLFAEVVRRDPSLKGKVPAADAAPAASNGRASRRRPATTLKRPGMPGEPGDIGGGAGSDSGPDEVTLSAGGLRLVIGKSASGFIREAALNGKPLAVRRDGLRGSFLDAFVPTDRSDPFAKAGRFERSRAIVTSLRGGGASVVARGYYAGGSWKVPFVLRVKMAGGGVVRVDHQIDLPASGGPSRIASWGVALPVNVSGSKHRVVFSAGGENRTETWRLDQSDEKFPQWLLSDSKSRWPIWRLGGLYQSAPGHYTIWKTSRADTSAFRVEEGRASAGWLDVSTPAGGVQAHIPDIGRRAPAALTIRTEGAGAGLYVYHHPPYAAPLDLRASTVSAGGLSEAERRGFVPGRRVVATVLLRFHPPTKPAELTRLATASRR